MTMQSIVGRCSAKLRQLRSASGANVTVIFALSLVPIAGAVGAAVDYSQGSSMRSAMQAAADAASLGTIKLASTLTPAQVQSTAAGMFNASFNRPQVTPTVSATYDAASNTVTVSASATFKPNLMSMIGVSQMTMSATSKATIGAKTWQVCVMITDPTKGHTLLVSGASKIDFTNCMVQVNTANWDAVEARDTSYIHSANGDNCFVGDIHYGDVQPPKDPTCMMFPDPYASIAMPASAANCDYTQMKVQTNGTVLTPGTYCKGLQLQNISDVTFSPGLYIISGGDLQAHGQGNTSMNITATGVTFILTGQNAGLDLKNVNFNITPATNVGAFSGFLFFLDQTTDSHGKTLYGNQSKIENVQMNTRGIIYLAGQSFSPTKGSAITMNPGSIIADVMQLDSASSFNLTGSLNGPWAALAR
jgi:Flp pilus assembly protein TadG